MQLPPDFISSMKGLPEDDFTRLTVALQQAAPVSIRANRAKYPDPLPYERVPWCETGYYLPERIPFTFDPLFHAGAYYVQEASSMFLEQVIKTYVTTPVRCLDLCAAPGGKSTHLAGLLPENSLLVANEVIRPRAHILSENMIKWGSPHTIVTNNDPEEIGKLPMFFDLIVADMPCSGEGMFRKDPGSIKEWSLANISLCAGRQRRIIRDIWKALKPGGLFIYSTCTYNTEENEDTIQYITEEFGAEPLSLTVKETWGITSSLKHNCPLFRFFPHKVKGEGFFLAALRKKEDGTVPLESKQKKKEIKNHPPLPPGIGEWLLQPEAFRIEADGAVVRAFPLRHAESYRQIARKLRTLSAGIQIGGVKGKDIVPAHSLAMSTWLNTKAFSRYGASWEEAIKYLRRETFPLPAGTTGGYVLLTYKGVPLGFVKQVGNRANNLYPQEWRIRSGYIPEEAASPLP